MKTFRQHIVEGEGANHADPHAHKGLMKDGFSYKSGDREDTYTTGEETAPKHIHDILTKSGYYPVTQSKADSRVKLPSHTHYEKEGVYSSRHAHIHHRDGDVSHVTFRTSRDNS